MKIMMQMSENLKTRKCFVCMSCHVMLLDVLSMATALDDFIAPDCRFINIKKDQMVYVYSKLVPEEGAGVFWSGSVSGLLLRSYTTVTAVTNKC